MAPDKEKRPALQRMIADCEAGRIDRILTKSLSRFARNTTYCLELTQNPLDLGVTIYFEKENLDIGAMEAIPAPTAFRMGKATWVFSNPYQQAEYLYSLIESEV